MLVELVVCMVNLYIHILYIPFKLKLFFGVFYAFVYLQKRFVSINLLFVNSYCKIYV